MNFKSNEYEILIEALIQYEENNIKTLAKDDRLWTTINLRQGLEKEFEEIQNAEIECRTG